VKSSADACNGNVVDITAAEKSTLSCEFSNSALWA
jgi:hypothetical protein